MSTQAAEHDIKLHAQEIARQSWETALGRPVKPLPAHFNGDGMWVSGGEKHPILGPTCPEHPDRYLGPIEQRSGCFICNTVKAAEEHTP